MSDRTPRVLFVCTVEAWPSMNGTGRRIEALTREIADVCDLTVLVSTHPGTVTGPTPPTMRVVRVERPRARLRSAAGMVAALLSGRPLVMSFYRRRSVSLAVRRLLFSEAFDLVVAQGIGGLALCRNQVAWERVVYDSSDALHETFASLAASLRGPARWQWALDAPRLRTWFARNLPLMRAVVAVSPHDEESFHDVAPAARVLVVPNGADPRPAPRPDPGGSVLLFVGDRDYEPNRDGLRWLSNNVLDRCPPGTRLRSVGPGEAPADPRIENAGFVPDLMTEWDGATASVVPTFAGGGTHLKIVEALAAGVPVISTGFGARGLGLQEGVHYLRADDEESFAAAIELVLRDADLRSRLSEAGRTLVRDTYSWAAGVVPLRQLVAESVDARPQRRSP